MTLTIVLASVSSAQAGLGDWIREELFPVRVIIREIERVVVVPDLGWLPTTPSGWYQLVAVCLMVLVCGKIFGVKIPKIKKPKVETK